MVPSHLRWLEVDAPDVLPAAVRAYRALLFFWLPLVGLAAIAGYVAFRGRTWGLEPAVLAGTAFIAVWLLVFLPPAALGLPVALKAGRAMRNGVVTAEARRRLRQLAWLHFALPALALLALVPCAPSMLAALRHHLGGA